MNKILAIVLLSLLVNSVYNHDFLGVKDPELSRNCPELIVTKGYPLETHKVHTSDGHILTVFRIPFGLKNQN